MRRISLATWAAAVASFGLLVPTTVAATAPIRGTTDIALGQDEMLVGEVVDPQGTAKRETPVWIQYQGADVVRTMTDINGVFAAKGLRDGEYQIKTDQGISNCHLWNAETAPRSARQVALVVAGNDVVRGQTKNKGFISECKGWAKAHPYITTAAVVTAVAVPLALTHDGWDSGK
ncbi:MAG TPA: hypothetical protein VHU84_11730 [Lacipirellulaceae bacterium]|nr:hypothetical protein [Lacipirellulaceae bacterium]